MSDDAAPLRTDTSDDIEAKANALLRICCDRDLTIATAESCTGGLIAALLTDIEGVSHAFDRAFVVYSENAKTELLGVPSELIESKSAVSRDVAIAMADGAIQRSQAGVAIAVTGYAGPSSEGDEGLVHLAVAKRNGAVRHQKREFGKIGRDHIRAGAAEAAIDMMLEALRP